MYLNFYQNDQIYKITVTLFNYFIVITKLDLNLIMRISFNITLIFVLGHKSVFLCTKGCGRSYKQKCTLNRHLKFECGIKPMFKCDLCGKCFRHTFTLKFHLADVHMIL